MKCNRCGKGLAPGEDEACWWCIEPLCFKCWDRVGHCGHPEAEAVNERARGLLAAKPVFPQLETS